MIKEIWKSKSKDDLYVISWEHQREKHFVAITNNLDKWLEQNNSEREDNVIDDDGSILEQNQETLSMFQIEQLETHIFDEVEDEQTKDN
tara:strand:- start:424 stop:690 length:267 start_codon:yes stop_codon:yes gene_type:complete